MFNFIVRLVEAARECVVNLPTFPPLLRSQKWPSDKDACPDDPETDGGEPDKIRPRASMVKELRERTGARMSDCVDALKAGDGDLKKAVEWLRVKNISRGEARELRAGEGMLASAVRTTLGSSGVLNTCVDMPMPPDYRAVYQSDARDMSTVMVEMSAATDFATRSPEFRTMLRLATMQAMLMDCRSLDELLGQQYLGDGPVADSVRALAEKFGEPISIRRFVRVDGPAGIYLHSDMKQAAIVELDGVSQEDAIELGKDLAMHVVFAKPKYLSRADVPVDEVERERDLVLRQLKEDPRHSRKPSEILDKIAMGQMSKFFGTCCLLDQPYYRENKKTVEAVLRAKRPEAHIKAFHLLVVGE